jgi:hypothetical protein
MGSRQAETLPDLVGTVAIDLQLLPQATPSRFSTNRTWVDWSFRADGNILTAELFVAGFEVDVSVNKIVSLSHTLERKGAVRPRVTDSSVNNYIGIAFHLGEPHVRVLYRATVGSCDTR